MIQATHRLVPIAILSSALVVIGVLQNPGTILLGVSLFLLGVALRGYTVLEYTVASKLKTSWFIRYGLEGENIIVEALIENRTWIPIVTAEVVIDHSPHLKLVDGSRAGVIVIPPRSAVKYRLVLKGRTGQHAIGPLKIVVRDPLGLFKSRELVVAEATAAEIKPKASEVVVRRLLVHTRSTGLTKVRRPGLGVEFYDTRDYAPGDELRNIDWKKFAFTNRLVVKEYEKEAYQTILFLVDATPYMTRGPFGETPFEHVARVTSSIALYLSKRGDLVGLVVYDHRKITSTGKLYRGKRAYYEVLKTLSKVEYSLEEFDESKRIYMLQESFKELIKMLPRERNIVFIFTCSWRTGIETLVEIVKRLNYMNSSVYIVVPIIAAYEVKGVSAWGRAVYRLKTLEKLREDIDFANKLRKLGAKVVAVGPELIPRAVVNIVESRA